jgi:ribosomal protein S12 methylthiotransferase accessory factor YcaO
MPSAESRAVPGTAGIGPQTGYDLQEECRRIGVTRLADLTGLDIVGLPVAQAVRPASKSISVNMGKGRTIAAAKLSAFGEAFELFCAENAAGLLKCGAAGFPAKGVFSGLQSPVPIDIIAFNLETEPNQFTSATGLAAHQDLWTAIRHGIYECIERHLYSQWFRAAPGRRVFGLTDAESISEDAGLLLVRHLERLGFKVLIWNIGHDAFIAAFLVELVAPQSIENSLVAYSQGMACHADSAVALFKALIEAVQTRMAYISGAREDLSAYDFFGRLREMADNRLDFNSRNRPPMKFRHESCPAEGELHRIRDSINELGLAEPSYVDLTPHESAMKAVKVLLPGALDDLGEEQSLQCHFQ